MNNRILTKRLAELFVSLFLLSISNSVPAGALDDFEESATKPRSSSGQSTTDQKNNECETFVGCLFEAMFNSFFEAIINGASDSSPDNSSGSYKLPVPDLRVNYDDTPYPDIVGDPILPIAKIDLNFHIATRELTARTIRAEFGYKDFAFRYSQSDYFESKPDDRMTLRQWQLLYRMVFGSHVAMNWGFGTFELSGNESHSTLSMAFPVQVQINSHWGLELKPNFANFEGSSVWDLEAGIVWTKKYIGVTTGYRRLSSRTQVIHGPYVGLSFFY